MILENVQALINHVRQLIEIQEVLKEISQTNSLNEKKLILSQYKEDENLQQVLKYAYDPNINFGENVRENIINLCETDTLDDVYPLWYMLDKLSENNNSKLMQQEFRDYMAFFPDIKDLITGIILKDLKLGLSTTYLNKIFPNLNLIPSNNSKIIQLFNN